MIYKLIFDKHVVSYWWYFQAVSLWICYLYSIFSFLGIYIFIDISVGAPFRVKDVVDVLNSREKWILKLEMYKLLNTESIIGNPNFYKSM